ncbi:hypothetical protein ACUN24_00940 [Pedobacter sp. WC2501]|uniref:hypothetical protein n=1 Tax=Pedobacter sp. WC2501 TaxID=3461400 RepID=UPI0040454F67
MIKKATAALKHQDSCLRGNDDRFSSAPINLNLRENIKKGCSRRSHRYTQIFPYKIVSLSGVEDQPKMCPLSLFSCFTFMIKKATAARKH